MPFGVWVDALDAYVAAQDPGEATSWDAALLAELAGVLPSLRRAGDADHGVADERYRAHRAMRELLERLAADQPLVLVLDDLHWSDTRLARADRRAAAPRARRARCCSRSPSGPARRRSGCPPPWPCPRCSGSSSSPLDEARGGRAARRGRRRRRWPPSTGTGAATRSTSSSSRARATRGRLPAASTAAATATARPACPPRSRRRWPSELESLPDGRARACSTAPRWRASRSSPTSPPRSPSSRQADGLDALDDLLALDLVRPTAGAAPLRLPPSARAPGGLRVDARRLAARRPRARGRGAGGPRRGRRPSAPTTSSSRPRRATRRRSSCCWRPAMPPPRARPPRRRAGSRRRCGCCPRPTRERQVDLRVALASALRSLGRAGALPRDAAGGVELLPAEDAARRVELTALCAAVEHWQGRHEDAHRRLSRAWEELPDRAHGGRGRAADRAGGRRPLRAGLRAGRRDGPRGARDRARGSATAR